MRNVEIPEILNKPLEICNPEQIKALRFYKERCEEREKSNSSLRKYEVNIHISGDVSIEVEAFDEDEAKEKALEEMTINDCDLEIEADSVREMK